MKKAMVLLYGNVCYHVGNFAFLCLVVFSLNLVPKNDYIMIGIDVGETSSVVISILINIALIALLGLQHSVMARPKCKKWLTQFIPEATERSTFVLASAIAILILVYYWQPIPTVIWKTEGVTYETLLVVSLLGWALAVYSSFLINHFDLQGLRQVWLYFKGLEYTQLPFQLKSLYKYIRHPIMTGMLIGIWFVPVMSVGHLLLTLGLTVYIIIGVYYEERDLNEAFGDQYQQYRQKTGMFFPVFIR